MYLRLRSLLPNSARMILQWLVQWHPTAQNYSLSPLSLKELEPVTSMWNLPHQTTFVHYLIVHIEQLQHGVTRLQSHTAAASKRIIQLLEDQIQHTLWSSPAAQLLDTCRC